MRSIRKHIFYLERVVRWQTELAAEDPPTRGLGKMLADVETRRFATMVLGDLILPPKHDIAETRTFLLDLFGHQIADTEQRIARANARRVGSC